MGFVTCQVQGSTQEPNSSGQDSAAHLNLKDEGLIEDSKKKVLVRQDRWLQRRVKEAIPVRLQQPTLNIHLHLDVSPPLIPGACDPNDSDGHPHQAVAMGLWLADDP